MKKKVNKINKLAYLGLLGLLSMPLALYTKNPKWFGLCGFFGFLGYFNVKQEQY